MKSTGGAKIEGHYPAGAVAGAWDDSIGSLQRYTWSHWSQGSAQNQGCPVFRRPEPCSPAAPEPAATPEPEAPPPRP